MSRLKLLWRRFFLAMRTAASEEGELDIQSFYSFIPTYMQSSRDRPYLPVRKSFFITICRLPVIINLDEPVILRQITTIRVCAVCGGSGGKFARERKKLQGRQALVNGLESLN